MATFDEAYGNYKNSAQGQAIAGMYDANRDANLANMEAEYNRSRSRQEEDAAKIAGNYRAQFNDLGAQYERQRRNNNIQAAANGLNTGTASQMQLAQSGNYQKAYSNLGAAQAQEEATAARGLADLEANYRSQVNAAIANSDYQKAAALLQGYNEDRQRQMNEAQLMAGYGNFDLYGQLYGADTANQMRELWVAQNPLLAYNTGAIDAERYRAMTGEYPPGYTPGSSGGGYYGGGSRKKNSTGGDALGAYLESMANQQKLAEMNRQQNQAQIDAAIARQQAAQRRGTGTSTAKGNGTGGGGGTTNRNYNANM